MAKEEAPKKKEKTPTALKRIAQSKKAQLRNRMTRSKIKTASKKFAENLPAKNQEVLAQDLKSIYSLVDKAVKSNVYKANKAKRIKAQYAKNFNKAVSV